ncbi:UNKNOWN [Stylonychia lemnae]|uniref:Uncharacterized protein n=1 Tax=Stylonychia lemnae TaxID=5949 RepID=A0A078A5N6_STYLE|nr:UNKNOWN [Stylonychia lemnae]|eukprot:CDW76074.1 UNKNOWN [Stylonychia lemnae]
MVKIQMKLGKQISHQTSWASKYLMLVQMRIEFSQKKTILTPIFLTRTTKAFRKTQLTKIMIMWLTQQQFKTKVKDSRSLKRRRISKYYTKDQIFNSIK